jgi:quercetin dioxygenase-like cupin family protein
VASLDELMSKLQLEAGSCYSWSNRPHDRYAAHSHPYEKVLYCVDGSITFVLERDESSGVQKRLELKPGDRMVLPAGTEHSAIVGPSGCTCIEGRR